MTTTAISVNPETAGRVRILQFRRRLSFARTRPLSSEVAQFMMLWLYGLREKIKPSEYIRLLNSHDLGKKKSNRLLSKTGIVTAGNAVIRPPFYFERGRVTLGRNVLINAGCIFLDQAGITIGDDTMLGPQVRLCTTTHDLNPEMRHSHTRSSAISIGRNMPSTIRCTQDARLAVVPNSGTN